MRKRVTDIGRGRRRDIEAVKKSLQNYVDIIVNSGSEDLIRIVERGFEKIFARLVQPKELHRKKGNVIPIHDRSKGSSRK
jgi:hypothetical protein